jgi:hypothetical protein
MPMYCRPLASWQLELQGTVPNKKTQAGITLHNEDTPSKSEAYRSHTINNLKPRPIRPTCENQ